MLVFVSKVTGVLGVVSMSALQRWKKGAGVFATNVPVVTAGPVHTIESTSTMHRYFIVSIIYCINPQVGA